MVDLANRQCRYFGAAIFVIWICLSSANAQTTTFTYQGRLTDTGLAAAGNYDFQFALYDSLTAGNQIGSTSAQSGVAVSGGVFTVQLDFGANAFPGAARYLEIRVQPAGGNGFTTLAPRQQITSTPYAVRSLSAATGDSLSSACVACVSDTQINSVAGSKVNGTIPVASVPAGSSSYVQNTTSQQASSNFNISGNGTAGGTLSADKVDATTQYNMGGSRFISISTSLGNLFIGLNAGGSNPTTGPNLFIGTNAGFHTTTGQSNTFIGDRAGEKNTGGGINTFVGESAGFSNTGGGANSYFGQTAGRNNLTGNFNSFFGRAAGFSTTTSDNSFFGYQAGINNTSGGNNSFFGSGAGNPDANTQVSNSTAIGYNAIVGCSHCIVLGDSTDTALRVGIGKTIPQSRLNVVGTSWFQGDTTPLSAPAGKGVGVGTFSSGVGYVFAFDYGAGTAQTLALNSPGGKVGIGTTAPDQTLSVNGNASKSGGGSWLTFSDERLKNIHGRFTPGLRAVMQLQPIRYQYKQDNALGLKSEGEFIGFGAQAVQKIIPEAVTKDDKGYLLVNNDPIMLTMLNAIKEQQALIEQQQKQIAGLKKLICRTHARALVCK